MVRRIVAAGHELASHGWDHTRVTEQTRRRSAPTTCSRTRVPPRGPRRGGRARLPRAELFHQRRQPLGPRRAGGHRATATAPASRRCGTTSTACPTRRALPLTPRGGRLREIPVTTLPLAGRNLNVGGGGWFRLFPYGFSRWALRRVNGRDGESAHFYFHPWEIDPGQPRIPEGRTLKTRCAPLPEPGRMERRLERLLRDFAWGRMDRGVSRLDPSPPIRRGRMPHEHRGARGQGCRRGAWEAFVSQPARPPPSSIVIPGAGCWSAPSATAVTSCSPRRTGRSVGCCPWPRCAAACSATSSPACRSASTAASRPTLLMTPRWRCASAPVPWPGSWAGRRAGAAPPRALRQRLAGEGAVLHLPQADQLPTTPST